MKKIAILVSVFAFVATVAFGQGVYTTASDFFKTVSDYYETIENYEANIELTIGNTSQSGRMSFMRPELIHIEIDSPDETVINFDGSNYQIYVSAQNAILSQQVSGASQGALGLSLIRRYYNIKYEETQDPVALDEGSDQMVIKLMCERRSASESFRYLILSIDPETRLVVRIEAMSIGGDMYIMNFSDYVLNTKMSETRFIYETPANANEYENFLFAE